MGIFSTDTAEQKERDRWAMLSEIVQAGLRNFERLGPALKEIRDKQLYRFDYATWADCCTARWKITCRHADRLVTAYETAAEIGPVGDVELSERQLRPLAALPIEQRREAFQEAQANGGTPAAVTAAVNKRRHGKRSSHALKRLRLKVPGGVLIIEPNRKATSYEQLLSDAVAALQSRQRSAA